MKRKLPLEPKDRNDIPKIRTRGEDIQTLYLLAGALTAIDKVEERMGPRLLQIPNAMKRLKWASSVLYGVMGEVLATFPDEKIETVQKLLPLMKMYIQCGKPAVNDPEYLYVKVKDLDQLAFHAHEKCAFCDEQNRCKTCALGQALDATMPHCRNGRSWFEMDLLKGDG